MEIKLSLELLKGCQIATFPQSARWTVV